VVPLLSDGHFPVDGTLLKARASMKSFQPKPEAALPERDDGPDDPPPLWFPEPVVQPWPDPPPFTRLNPAADPGRRQGL